MHFVGLDAGSVSVKVAVLDKEGAKVKGRYVRHYGHPVNAALDLLREIKDAYPESGLSLTGSASRVIAAALKIKPVNEVVAQSYSVRKLYPRIRTIIEMGGEDSKLILLDEGRIRDFSMNSLCAAGTGSFLEQQAERLRLGIEEFSALAVQSRRPSKVAGRCSVFAKSDMIHLQQIATPVEDIVAGLCFAVARNFKGTIARGRDIVPPVAFQGGVAANKGMVRAFKEVFELDELFIPDDFALMGALGAAMRDRDEGLFTAFSIETLEEYLRTTSYDERGHAPLFGQEDDFPERHLGGSAACPSFSGRPGGKEAPAGGSDHAPPVTAYLGIDIGSISTNLAVIDESGTLLAKRYLMTAGRPIDAVRQGLAEIQGELGDTVEIRGVGTTGSGRYMIADYVGADIVKNEITAQAAAAIFINPEVDTILEIGGQDSKYISLRDGIIIDFEMNKACAAGTGSFIEEQAEKLDISVKGEFAARSFRSKSPCRLGERCTVFMENSLMASLQRGADKDNLVAGLAYSIVQNYVNRVVAGKPIGRTVFFQGGVAFNKAVVAAFERYLGKEVIVPPHHDVTGAIGMALIALRYMQSRDASCATMFKGFALSQRGYEVSSFACKGCSNVCEINKIKMQGEDGHLFYGGRCEKYDLRRARRSSLPDLFSFREEMLWKDHEHYLNELSVATGEADPAEAAAGRVKRHASRGTIGIPYIFYLHDYLPFWSTLLWELGFDVVVSPKTNKQIITLGLENVLSEACFPVKVAHGHIKYLVDTGIDAVLLPSFIDTGQAGPGGSDCPRGLACPHTQTIPYVSKAAIKGVRALTPVVDSGRGQQHLVGEVAAALGRYGIRKSDVERALPAAAASQERFTKAVKEKGREVLADLAAGGMRAVVIVGRAYNAFDPSVNLEIPKKLSTIEVLSLPMDMLPLESVSISRSWPNMYWRSGQRILKAARLINTTPNLHAIYIGNFSCGPDSFILKYFKEEMRSKPFLHIEIDEHSADAGAITRCEAFLDSIEQQNGPQRAQRRESSGARKHVSAEEGGAPQAVLRSSDLEGRTVFIPHMADHAFALKAAFTCCGVRAEVLPPSDKESVDIGRRYVSGKECFPYLVTAGDMLKKALAPDFRPEQSAFFMPSGTGPCRFGQYNISHKMILEKLGLGGVPIFAPNQDVGFYRDLGIAGSDFSMAAWKGIIAYELLTKCLHETRPYERSAGDAEALYRQYHERISRALQSRNGAMERLLRDMRDGFEAIPRRREQRPLIGIIGEIFVRTHQFSNEDLVRKIEALGGEVWLAPIEEWVYYVNTMSLRKALIKRRRSDMMNILLKRFFQKRIEHRYGSAFKGFLKTLKEPETGEILKKAAPYVHDSFEGETVLSIGKAVDLIERGAAGIISAMPFGCMPGTIVAALLKAITRDYGIPCISIPYDGTESPAVALHIEAFMETVGTDKDK